MPPGTSGCSSRYILPVILDATFKSRPPSPFEEVGQFGRVQRIIYIILTFLEVGFISDIVPLYTGIYI